MSGGEAVKQLSVAVAVFCGLLGAIYVFRPETPVVRRQYPFSGLAIPFCFIARLLAGQV